VLSSDLIKNDLQAACLNNIVVLNNMFRLLIDRFEDSLQIAAGNLQTDQSHLERYFENSYKKQYAVFFYQTIRDCIPNIVYCRA